MKGQRNYKIAKTILKKRQKVGRNILPGFKTYYIATVIKTGQHW